MTSGVGDPMRVLETGVYRGPHLYSQSAMVRIQLDLGRIEAWPTNTLPGFTDALLAALPGLHRHGCCYREPGGFVRRLRDGTWLGHVVEHVALELQSMVGAEVTRGKTRSVKNRPGVYNVMYAYEHDATALLAGRLALQIVNALLPSDLQGIEGLDRIAAPTPGLAEATTLDLALPILRASARSGAFGPSTQSLVTAASRRGIPVSRLNAQSLVQIGWGSRQRRLRASVTDRTGLIAAESAGDKAEAKALLDAIGCPVAKGTVVVSVEQALIDAKRMTAPLVIKPLDGNHGRGVTTGLRTEEQIRDAFARAVQHSRRVIVEEELPGKDHRILVVGGKVVAVAERVPAHVVGDGEQTIRQLVTAVNADPRRGDGHENMLTRLRLDEAAIAWLDRQGLGPDDVPKRGRTVSLTPTANLSSGGEAIDRTDEIHPDNASIARRAALAIGLDVAGIDMLAPDITRSIRDTGGGIVEVNAAPGLRMHLAPSAGVGRDVGADIIDMMYPRGTRSRIPVLAITGTNGKSTVGRMVAQVMRSTGATVGLTNTSGVYIDDERVYAGDASGPRSARLVFRDPTVDVAVLECARGGILREGLAFDRCDVGAVLNVQADHLGLKGIDTLEDLAAVKSVVTESVSRRGVSVLNADDTLTLRMARHAGGRLCWFSMRGGDDAPGFLLKHIADGGLAVTHEPRTGEIVIHDKGDTIPLCRAAEIPATIEGLAEFNVQNALAAAAMTYAAGVAPAQIAASLRRFASTFEQNPGRLNVHEAHGFTVILDYAHNPDGIRALGKMVAALKGEGHRSIAMLSIPGDRRNEEIVQMGGLGAEYFDQLVFRETPDNRGRPAGDVIALMTQGALAAGCRPDRILGVHKEEDAVLAALQMARRGDIVVLTPTGIESVWKQVLDYRPKAPIAGPQSRFDRIMEPPHG